MKVLIDIILRQITDLTPGDAVGGVRFDLICLLMVEERHKIVVGTHTSYVLFYGFLSQHRLH